MKKSKVSEEQRITEVLQMRLAGAQMHDIVQHAREQKWNASEADISRFVEASDAAMAMQLAATREEKLAIHLARRESLYANCVRGGDFGTALAVLRDSAALLSLYPEKKTKGESRPATSISVIIGEQRSKVLEQLPEPREQLNIESQE